jgi:ketosteroid isomerase-like protein
MRIIIPTILLLCLTLVTSNSQAQSASDEKAIQAFTSNYVSAYNAQDIRALQSLYTADAVLVDSTGQKISGADNIGEYFANYFRNRNVTLQLHQKELNWSDYQHAFVASGRFKLSGRTIVYDIPINASGTYSNTMLKIDGNWKISHSIFSTDEK